MKYYIYILITILALSQGCDLDQVSDDFDLRISPELMENSAMLNIFNGNDPTQFPENVKLTVLSDNAEDVFEMAGSKDLDVIDGRIGIGLHPRLKPQENAPVVIDLLIEAEGYLDKRVSVNFVAGEETNILEIPLVDTENPPSGVNFTGGNAALDNGTLNQEMNLELQPDNGSSTGMKLNLKPGTEFLDDSGNKLNGTNLDIQMGHFSPETADAVETFPGGLSPDSVELADGTAESGGFVSAGFTSIDMQVNGQDVKNFSEPITVTMDVSSNTVNPNTGELVQVGDTIPVWSFDQETNIWKYETDGEITQGDNGLVIEFEATHLSWWNLDYYGRRCCGYTWTRVNGRWEFEFTPCATINVNMPGFTRENSEYFEMRILYAGTNRLFRRSYKRLFDGESITILNAPSFDVEIKVFDRSTGEEVGSTGRTSLCSGTIDLNVDAEPPQIISVDAEGICTTEDQLIVRPTFWVFYRPTQGRSYFRWLGYMKDGRLSTTELELNTEYEFCAYYDGERVCTIQTITQAENDISIELPTDFCESI